MGQHPGVWDRREFFRAAWGAVAALPLTGLLRQGIWAAPQGEDDAAKASAGAPANLSWRTVMVKPDEPGEPLIVAGTIYAADGQMPVEGARLYVYQTDAKGYYVPRLSLKRTPRIRGWMKTGADGRYEFRTIKPGSYPGERIPAHIHGTLSAPGHAVQWIDDFWFDGDPHLKPEDVARAKARGNFSPVLTLARGTDGVLHAQRNFILVGREQ